MRFIFISQFCLKQGETNLVTTFRNNLVRLKFERLQSLWINIVFINTWSTFICHGISVMNVDEVTIEKKQIGFFVNFFCFRRIQLRTLYNVLRWAVDSQYFLTAGEAAIHLTVLSFVLHLICFDPIFVFNVNLERCVTRFTFLFCSAFIPIIFP